MRHLFSPEGEAALAATMRRQPLLAFDFDGTLAPIVATPDDARIPEPVARRLGRLAALAPVAIISGRDVDDLRPRLSFQPHYIIGNHGAEDPSIAGPARSDVLACFRSRLGRHLEWLQAAGVTVEEKRESIALHYRAARNRKEALEVVSYLVQGLPPDLRAFGGKLVMNIVSATAPDKAHAVATLVERSNTQSAMFVGDDVNDEPVFASAQPSWLTVKVGSGDASSLAMYCLDDFDEVVGMLDRMLICLEAGIDSARP